ncbi:UvrD-helicase domain-containing protein [Nonomuraea jiangxiensis]|uniref:DNA 3'-5' helicase n=1 Tax=Nonomuraea jiangxiensis TaxID=633440 RepID=A0A1G9LN43_9ACTN|nr:UvrD-helicase domain-containing protein [Nonomuraea jiangxiensis]SDL63348.1 UvrD-like helicase C-terminal domain-containing protein [Nonomuraea jiangxiensis]
MARLAIDSSFLWEFGKLNPDVQERVQEVFAKFQAGGAGINLEKIHNAKDERFRSIRIDQGYRGIVLAPEQGDLYLLLKVDQHDAAYRWAERHKVSVNSTAGVVEVIDVVGVKEATARNTASGGPDRLFDHVSDAQLRTLGIDEQTLAFARSVTDQLEVEKARRTLGEAQYDVLIGLAMGMTPEEVWNEVAQSAPVDIDDMVAATERTSRRLILVTGPDELMDVFSQPFALWRVYLHPSQLRVAHARYSGPARVSGGPGTGKTVVALHRARHLARRVERQGAVLLTTFTKTLAASLDDGLRALVSEPDLLERVDVRHIDQVAHQIVAREHGRLSVLNQAEEVARWAKASSAHEPAFLAAEWRQVILAQGITTLLEYQGARRKGRGVRLSSAARETVWEAFEAFSSGLRKDGVWTHETICVEATRLLTEADRQPYEHVIVDEAQDLSPWQWRFLRAVVPVGPDDLFIAGDTHQRIYDNRASLRQVGVDVTGRSTRLKINYRTTAEILAWCVGLLRGQAIDDMNEDLESLTGCRSDVHGNQPRLEGFASRQDELAFVTAQVQQWLDDGVEPEQVGIAMRARAPIGEVVNSLAEHGIPAASLASQAAHEGKVLVGTMHRMKGLEFRCMVVTGVSDNSVPAPSAVTLASLDKAAHALDLQRERCVLFVACTRAREELLVTWTGVRSPFLPVS